MNNQEEEKSVFHDFKETPASSFSPQMLVIFLVVILAGVGSGYILSQKAPFAHNTSQTATTTSGSSVAKGAVFGSDDTKTFSDSAEGVVQAGGIDGEGQYHLVRPGGDSQNVYMTSSLVDLSALIGRKVKVNGQTQKAQHAGWLMDVGRVEVLE